MQKTGNFGNRGNRQHPLLWESNAAGSTKKMGGDRDRNGQSLKGQTMNSGQSLREIVRAVPDLNCFGFGLWAGHQHKPLCERRRIFAEERRHLLTEEDDFRLARAWIRENLKPQTRINKLAGSYGLKHLMERDTDIYTTNGAFICAMLAEGFEIERCAPNAFFNVSTRSIRAAQRRVWKVRR
ncbi:MAG: hypothetical protein KF893_25565 [Caldilineaceae bacterium]|nr:hypothetical protein [Caldilineaceae bacterium]